MPLLLVRVRRHFVQSSAEDEKSQIQIFLNSVPLLASLDSEDKAQLVDAFLEETYAGGHPTQCGSLLPAPAPAYIRTLTRHVYVCIV